MTSRQDLSLSSTAALDPPIFVVGYMHSGTTLLLNILSTHPAVFSCKGESKWFELLPIVRSEFSSLENEQTLLACIAFAGNVINPSCYLRKGDVIDAGGQDKEHHFEFEARLGGGMD